VGVDAAAGIAAITMTRSARGSMVKLLIMILIYCRSGFG
jgi:hypothetical protein